MSKLGETNADADHRPEWADLHDFNTTLTDLAHCLDPTHAAEPFEARRARAIGVLADPAHAAALLAGTGGFETSAEPPPQPPARRRRVELVVHVTEQTLTGARGGEVARVETPTGGAGRPVLAQQVAAWCGRDATEVKVTKVIDLNTPAHVDRYEIGDRMARRIELREPTCVFPWCSRPARHSDKDHVIPHHKDGPTNDTNLAPLCRRHHRLKTHTPWTYQPLPLGGWRWTDPHGLTYHRDHHGTRPTAGETVQLRQVS